MGRVIGRGGSKINNIQVLPLRDFTGQGGRQSGRQGGRQSGDDVKYFRSPEMVVNE